MLFKEVIGQERIKTYLTSCADAGDIPHAQLFIASEGNGALPMAIAYAQYILCHNTQGENAGENSACNLQCSELAHPDLHVVFPVAATGKIKSRPVSADFMEEWRLFVKEQPYGGLFDWYQRIGIENQQGQIGVDEAQQIAQALSLKAYEGGYKVMLIWMAEKMNTAAANKLLKLVEEPPHKTLFILLTEAEEQLEETIRSRCQVLRFPPLPEKVVADALRARGTSEPDAVKIACQAQGNFNKALYLLHKDSEDVVFERWFIAWIRTAFKARGNKSAIHDLLAWSEEVAGVGRETQKQFLHYGLEVFRQAFLLNYGAESLVYLGFRDTSFQLAKLAPFISGNTLAALADVMQNGIYHIERNGNAKIILTDLSVKLTRLIHTS